MKLTAFLIVVEDIAVSRRFYEEVFCEKVLYDFGENIQFESNLSIHQKAHFARVTGISANDIANKTHNAEIYFEEDDLEDFFARIQALRIPMLHGPSEQPWGQRVLRLFDPDGHLIEVGETLQSVVKRYLAQGLSVQETARRTSMPLEFVEGLRG
jgi:catechol 2,3-dioxygenase-like lactoylglutathione lyase family enzyme